ncbi:hypothetical protein ABEV74_22820 [Paenibacillus cisolokensis]
MRTGGWFATGRLSAVAWRTVKPHATVNGDRPHQAQPGERAARG